MIALGIDTSTMSGSVGLVDDESLLAEVNLRSDTTHSERLLSSIDLLLRTVGRDSSELDLIAVSCGPGSFTGLRIGMATARGLGLATKRPVVGFSTLETMAVAIAGSCGVDRDLPIAVFLEAGRGEVYRGVYRCDGLTAEPVLPERTMRPEAAVAETPEGAVLCTNVEGIVERAAPCPFIGAVLARRGIALARSTRRLPALRPNYLRASDAERTFGG